LKKKKIRSTSLNFGFILFGALQNVLEAINDLQFKIKKASPFLSLSFKYEVGNMSICIKIIGK